jgi:hypothetical protein
VHLPVSLWPLSSTLDGSRHRRREWPRAARAILILTIGAGQISLSGCSGRSSFLTGGPTMGQMKTSLAHLEYENAQMKRDLAKLRRENRQIEDRLVQQEQDNGELTARLDDARNLLRERGLEPDERTAAGRDGSPADAEAIGRARTLPAGQSSRKRRKPPVARIPGQFSPAAPDRDPDDEDGTLGPPQAAPNPAAGADQTGLRSDDELDHHTGYTGPMRWAPIAGRAGATASRVR